MPVRALKPTSRTSKRNENSTGGKTKNARQGIETSNTSGCSISQATVVEKQRMPVRALKRAIVNGLRLPPVEDACGRGDVEKQRMPVRALKPILFILFWGHHHVEKQRMPVRALKHVKPYRYGYHHSACGKTKNARQGIEHRGGMTPAPTGNRCVGARSSRPQGRAAGV